MDNHVHPPSNPRKFGIRERFGVWFSGRIDGPKHKKGVLPLGTLEPAIAHIQHEVEKRSNKLAAMCSYYRHAIPAAIAQAQRQLARPQRDLTRRQRALDEAIDRYKADHDGLEPPERGARFTQLRGFWLLGGLFTAGELPLMAAALERLPLPDWQRFIASVSASVVTVYLAHQIGVWFAKPGKTLAQSLFGWFLVAVLGAMLTFAAIARRDVIREHQKSPASSSPQVHIFRSKGDTTHHV